MNDNIKRRSFLKMLAALPLLTQAAAVHAEASNRRAQRAFGSNPMPLHSADAASDYKHTHMPPQHFNCRCRYITIDATDYDSDSPITITLIREMRDGGI